MHSVISVIPVNSSSSFVNVITGVTRSGTNDVGFFGALAIWLPMEITKASHSPGNPKVGDQHRASQIGNPKFRDQHTASH
jgi:hypothetical protein